MKHALYDDAVAEVRGEADDAQVVRLKSNIFAWRDALQNVVDEVDAQMSSRNAAYSDLKERGEIDGEGFDTHSVWLARAQTFRRHVYSRLLAVQRLAEASEEEEEGVPLQQALEVAAAAVEFVRLESNGDVVKADRAFDSLVEAVTAYEVELTDD